MAERGINKVIIVGNLGQTPELRYMPNGGAVASLTLATSENWRDKVTGEQKEKTEWHRVVVLLPCQNAGRGIRTPERQRRQDG